MKVLSSICIVIFWAVQSIICDDVVVTVEQGQLAGQLVDAVIGNFKYYSFKGIPYAQPPTGSLRFKAPQKLDSWDGVRNASEHGNVCPQFNPITSVYTAGSEDCLFLNVYTPDLKPETPLPVVFFIHGGAFMFGSGNTDLYGPDFLVAKKVIVVTINYRLNNLGFLSLGTKEVPGNAGLKDQLAALQWVNKNIESFGGSPNKITILGNTAGSASVTYHILSPLSKGLFQRAIAMSGTTSCDWGLSFEPVRRAFALGESLGFTGSGTNELLNHLQKAEVKDIVNASPTVISAEKTNNVLFKLEPFSPVVEQDFGDNNFITEDPLKTLISGNVNPVDVMFGYNSQEALLLVDIYNASYIEAYRKNIEMFTPVEILFDTPAKQYLEVADNIIKFYFGDKTVSVDNIAEFVSYASNASIAYHVHRFFSKWPKVGSTYLYKFSSPTRRNYYSAQGAKYNILGVSHFDDVFSLFNAESLDLPLVEGTQEYKTMQQLTDAVTNFAKIGNPSPDSSLGVTWPEYDNVGKAYVDIGTELTVGNAPDDKDVDFWKSMYELVGKKF